MKIEFGWTRIAWKGGKPTIVTCTVAGRSHGNLKTTHSLSSQRLFEMSDLKVSPHDFLQDYWGNGGNTSLQYIAGLRNHIKHKRHQSMPKRKNNVYPQNGRCVFLPPWLFQPLIVMCCQDAKLEHRHVAIKLTRTQDEAMRLHRLYCHQHSSKKQQTAFLMYHIAW